VSDRSAIEWTDATWNPVRGCSRVSEGCRHCYAERVAARFSGPGMPYEGLATMRNGEPRWTGEVRLVEKHLDDPLRWRTPRRIFVNSMSDLFHERLTDEQIDRVFMVMALAQRHTFQILTKRPGRMRDYMRGAVGRVWARGRQLMESPAGPPGYWSWDGGPHELKCDDHWPLPNVWIGVSCEHQAAADERIPLLLQTPAAVRFVSAEPLLGPIQFGGGGELYGCGTGGGKKLDWIIVGGESGPGARPMRAEWVRSIRDGCQWAGVAFFFKQWGGVRPKAGGRALDGRTWSEFPATGAQT